MFQIYLFTENQYVDRRRVSAEVKLPPDEIKEILSSVARLRYGKGWELLIPPDLTFEQKHQDIVQRQALMWQAKQRLFSEMLKEPVNASGIKRQRKRSQRESVSLDDASSPVKGQNHINGLEETMKCNGVNVKSSIIEGESDS